MTIQTTLPPHVVAGIAFVEACNPASCEASVQALIDATLAAGAEICADQVWRAYVDNHIGRAFLDGFDGTDEPARAAIAAEERNRIKRGLSPSCGRAPS